MNYKDLINAIMTGNKQSATEMFKTAMEAKANEALEAVKSTVYPQVAEELSDEELGQSIVNEWTEEDLEKLVEELVEELDLSEEQIDELSPSTLGSYIKKASDNARIKTGLYKSFDSSADSARKADKKAAFSRISKEYMKKAISRQRGVDLATDKLTKKAMKEEAGE